MAQRYATLTEVIDATNGIAPELSAFPTIQGEIWLEIAECQIGLTRWGKRASLGHALLTAHLISVSAQAGSLGVGVGETGPLASEAVGPASRSYAVNTATTDEALSGTSYGRQYMALRRVVCGIGSAIVGNTMIVQKG